MAGLTRPSIHTQGSLGEGSTKPEFIYAAAYAVCAFMAFKASRTSPNAGQAAAGPFWLRIAVICGLFTLLRAFDAQMAVSAAVRDFSHSAGLTDWARPGPYIMLVALAAFTIAIAGLFLFRFRTLHRSVPLAALTIIALALLAVAHSASLHVTQTVLQAPVGPLTVSRVIEAVLLLVLGYSAIWYIRDRKAVSPQI